MLNSEQTVLRDALATLAQQRWGLEDGMLVHIADSGNAVFRIEAPGQTLILRLTNPEYRTRQENEAELEYLRHLESCNIRIGAPVASLQGLWTEEVVLDGTTLLASVFGFVDGELVSRNSPYWNQRMFEEWGRSLARIHMASEQYRPKTADRRWQWEDELLVRSAHELIPTSETEVIAELDLMLGHLQSLERTPDRYGMIHADFAPQNFRYDPDGDIGVFDFGNCCYHWYASDLAISLSTLRSYPHYDRNLYRTWILEGYNQVRSLSSDEIRSIPWLVRLRIMYVYLSRLYKFGATPDSEQKEILDLLRGKVLEQFEWDEDC